MYESPIRRPLITGETSYAKITEDIAQTVEGKPTKIICDELDMSQGTAKAHIGAIFRALRVRNRTQATLVALRDGWIYPEMWSRS